MLRLLNGYAAACLAGLLILTSCSAQAVEEPTTRAATEAPAAEEESEPTQAPATAPPTETPEEPTEAPAATAETADLVLAGEGVYLVDLAGPMATQIVELPDAVAFFHSPRWSPDSSKIALLAQPADEDNFLHTLLYTVNPDGSELVALTSVDDIVVRSFSWSPAGNQIAVQGAQPGEDYESYLVDPAEGGLVQITQEGGEGPSWSPDGSRLAVSAFRQDDYQLYTVDPSTGEAQQVTASPGRAFQPNWSPTGELLAFASDRDGEWDSYDIYVTGADGEGRARLTEDPTHEIFPVWSPQADRIAFLRQRIDGRAAYDLVVMDADGSNIINLSADALDDSQVPGERYPHWSPDGSTISILGGDSAVYLFQSDGSGHETLELGPEVIGEAAWSPTR